MKAWLLHGVNDIRYEDVDMPVVLPGEVLVKIEAAGICGSDIPRTFDTGAHKMPLIIGHEFSGTVVDNSKLNGTDNADASKWLGKRVGIFPLIPCKKCKPCQDKHYEMCRNYSYLGSRRDGAFAEYVSVPIWNLIGLPDSVSFEEAAMLEPMSVAVHAMRIGLKSCLENKSNNEINKDNVWDNKSIVVCGLGTIGLLLVQFLIDAGCRNIYVIGNKDLQKSLALKLGIAPDRYCDSKVEDTTKWIMEKTEGVDLFFECVGRNECISLAIDCAAPGGRVVFVGNPYGDISLSRKTYWKILRNQVTILGTWNSSFWGQDAENLQNTDSDDWHYVLDRLNEKRIDPKLLITHRYPLESLFDGLLVMRDKKEEYCKVMISKE